MTDLSPFGISKKSFDKLMKLFAQTANIERVIIYGSRAMGTYKPGSDIDLTLVGSDLDIDQLLRIQSAIEDLSIPYMVDLSLFSMLTNENLMDHISRVGQEFFRKEHPSK